ncbi:transcription antitermination factor NusB [Alkalibacter saccharofermentans]|jgi:N utilization substance protein B|uniref:Transcription antitermination protein NusB n=1 Tax=Alkalibacter saccharofermentans DSM 14828 TaxID=1120975 RepID=A0A1M4UFR9_9FIRM|nr:transcription antitermination factor NusB [Alkalibacter saccharofermentans]SHE55410.1 NusB antitermination factor [Alkalibacter saccharofermentans DSM 14828]
MSRKFARELVLKIAYQMNFEEGGHLINATEAIDRYRDMVEEPKYQELTDSDREFIEEILKGIDSNREVLDERINEHLINWTLDRLNIIDSAMMRIAAYEILFLKDTPKAIVINEALNLVSKFGDEKSTKYINAVLDNLESNEE